MLPVPSSRSAQLSTMRAETERVKILWSGRAGSYRTSPIEESRAMSHDQTGGTDRRTFLQAGALATAAALGATGHAEAQDAAREGGRPPQAETRQDRHRDHDARDGHGRPPRAGRARAAAPAVLRQRRPHLRHRQGLRHRARLQAVVRAVARGPQGDRPGHQGQSQGARRTCWRCSTGGSRPSAPITWTCSSSTAWATSTASTTR